MLVAEEEEVDEELGTDLVVGWVLLVVGGGCHVEVGGGGGFFDVVVWGCESVPSTNSHSPYMMPTDCGAKKEKSPGLRSSPPQGHPGHVSWTVAVVVLPP